MCIGTACTISRHDWELGLQMSSSRRVSTEQDEADIRCRLFDDCSGSYMDSSSLQALRVLTDRYDCIRISGLLLLHGYSDAGP
jgi:hypothetical protein